MTRHNAKTNDLARPTIATGADSVSDYGRHGFGTQRRCNRYVSVCSGIEAASVAWHPLGWQCVGVSEIEKFPSAVLAHHYPSVPNFGDFTTIQPEMIDGPIDLLVGGTPCQSFSVAGLRGGMDDERGNLALEFCRLAGRLRPRWVVWENVPGVLSSNSGSDFGCFLRGMAEFGYFGAWRTLDAQYFGLAQRRKRVFAVFHLGDWRAAAAVLLERESMRRDHPPCREAGERVAPTVSQGHPFSRTGNERVEAEAMVAVAPTLRAGGNQTGGDRPPGTDVDTCDSLIVAFQGNASASQSMNPSSVAPTLDLAKAGGTCVAFDTTQITSRENGSNPQPGDPCHPLARGAHAPAIAIQGSMIGRRDAAGHCGPGFSEDGASFTLTKTDIHGVSTGMSVRRLTPRECERLQGFPDDYTLIPWRGKDAADCPDGPRYKALGNSMAVPVMRWIAERIQMWEARS